MSKERNSFHRQILGSVGIRWTQDLLNTNGTQAAYNSICVEASASRILTDSLSLPLNGWTKLGVFELHKPQKSSTCWVFWGWVLACQWVGWLYRHIAWARYFHYPPPQPPAQLLTQVVLSSHKPGCGSKFWQLMMPREREKFNPQKNSGTSWDSNPRPSE